jgi:hypothetical protein
MRMSRFLTVAVAITTFGAPFSVVAQDTEDKFIVHGYLSQAYARSDGLPVFGITKNGTWDYRVLSLQGHYALTNKDRLVVQLRNRRIGNNLANDDGVVVTWAYYNRDIGPFSAKVGRVPMPFGLLNEIRFVGTLLPFYRAPGRFYIEGIETIDGVSLSHKLQGEVWGLESTIYGGGIAYNASLTEPGGAYLFKTRVEDNYGVHMLLTTPIPGIRLGATAIRFQIPLPNDTTANAGYVGSVEGVFERFFVRSEVQSLFLKRYFSGADERQDFLYVQGGIKLAEPLWLNAQWEAGVYKDPGFQYRQTDDVAIGLSHALESNLVIKLEGHRAKGYFFDVFRAPPTPPGKSVYGIASLSLSF